MKQYLVNKIIDKYESSKSDWNKVLVGNRSLKIEEADYRAASKQELLKEATQLEERGLLVLKWVIRGSDLDRIKYSLGNMPLFYEMADRMPKYELVSCYIKEIETILADIKKEWVKEYLEHLKSLLFLGKIPEEYEKKEKYFACIKGLDELTEPMYKRIFSKRYLGSSKVFERELESHIITITKNYNPEVDGNMDDSQILSQIFIEEYAQELAVKGTLAIMIDERKVDLGIFRYGTVLNSDTLKHAKILPGQSIRKIVTIENKANFMIQPFEEGVLYLFSHGYFSPKEKEFLKKLEESLREGDTEYFHSGDLDYGGLCIYCYIKNSIFPKLKPYNMDVEIYRKYLDYGEPVKKETLQKLKNLKEKIPEEMERLLEEIVKEEKSVEQEIFLSGR